MSNGAFPDINNFFPSEDEINNINIEDDGVYPQQEWEQDNQQPSVFPNPIEFNQQPVQQSVQQEQQVVQNQLIQQEINFPEQQVQQPVQQVQTQQPVQVQQVQTQQPVQEQQPVQVQQVQQEQQAPLSNINNAFTPNVNEKKIIAVISPGNYDNMIKILQVLNKDKGDDAIIIRNSMITQSQADCIIEANMSSVLKNKAGELVSLDIINPKKYIKLLEQFKSQDDIFIIDDNENSRYVITNGEVRLFLPKQDSKIEAQEAENFDMTNAQSICTLEVDKDIRRIVKNLAKDQDYIDYLIQDNQVKAIHIPDTAVYTFPNFKNDEKAQKLDETNSDMTLRSGNFLPVEADNYMIYIITLGKDKYASVADCKVGGKIDIRVTELCDLCTGGNLLF
jgi:hypothetical protein